jgi:hypothetical protein
MAKLINVMIKNVGAEPRTAEIVHNLAEMQEIVGGYIERIALPNNIDLWVNEEGGLEENPKLNLVVVRYGDIIYKIVGNVFFAGHDGKGETISLTPNQIKWLETNLAAMVVMGDGKGDRWKLYELPIK